MENYMKLEIPSKRRNESFARAAVGAFATQLDLTCEDLADIKTAVSEAVTNSIIHGYGDANGVIEIMCKICGNQIIIVVKDRGKGIEDVNLAMQPLYSGSPDEESSGMGFTVMESFMNSLKVDSTVGEGTCVTMTKRIGFEPYV